MRAYLILSALLISFAASAAIERKQDRFTGKTTLQYSSQKGLQHASTGKLLFNAFRETENGEELRAYLFVTYAGRNWRYLRCESVHWLLDGSPLDLPEPIFSRDTHRGGVSETMIQPMSLEQMTAMGSAATLELKICNDELTFSSVDIQGLGELVRADP
jgi:hypothetical protein